MPKPLDFAALRRRFAFLRVLSMVGFAVVCVTAIGLAYFLTK